MKKFLSFILLFCFLAPQFTDAAVSVKGYYRKDGTYVAPHVRSNPNGVKYDNYGYKQSDGLYNKTYGTRGSEWDTPTYYTDPDYYTGQAIYNSSHTNSTYIPTGASSYTNTYNEGSASGIKYVTGGYLIGSSLTCNSGYYKKNNSCISTPSNSTAYGGDTFYCDSGYQKTDAGCKKLVADNGSYSGTSLVCDTGFIKSKDRCINYDTYCAINNGPSYFYQESTNSCATCSVGYKYNYTTGECYKYEKPSRIKK